MGNDAFGINTDVVKSFAIEINDVVKSGVQICIVVGGGNIYRGISGTKNWYGQSYWRSYGNVSYCYE